MSSCGSGLELRGLALPGLELPGVELPGLMVPGVDPPLLEGALLEAPLLEVPLVEDPLMMPACRAIWWNLERGSDSRTSGELNSQMCPASITRILK